MARGKRKASVSTSRLVSEDGGGPPPVTDSVEESEVVCVETSESIPTTMDVEENEVVLTDEVNEEQDVMVGTISQPSITIFSIKGEENTVEMEAVSTIGDQNETILEETVSEPNITTEYITEELNGENISELAANDVEHVLKEVVNGEEDVAKMVAGIGEDITNGERNETTVVVNNDEGVQGGSKTTQDDLLKEGCLSGQGELGNEETIKETVEKKTAQKIKSRKRKRGKKGAKGPFNKLAFKVKKDKVHSNDDAAAENGDKMEQEKADENTEDKKVEENGKQRLIKKSQKSKRGKRGKVVGEVLENAVASELGGQKVSNGEGDSKKGVSEGKSLLGSKDVPESSSKKKSKGKVEGMGLIFMCNSETKKDCYQYKILGLPSNKREVVENIYKGMRLFLYDVDLKLLYGIYKAAAPGGFNIEPKAFKSQFPSQVRFTVLEDCNPLAEEKFKSVIKKNYYTKTKFRCELTTEQVKDLCNLFTANRQSSNSKKPRRLRKESIRSIDRDRTRKRVVDRLTRPKVESRSGGIVRDRVIKKIRVDRNRRRSPVNENAYRDHRPRHYDLDQTHPFSRAPVVRGSHLPLHPLSSGQPYVYDRVLETDPYRRGPLVMRGSDSYRHDDRLMDRRRYDLEPKLEHHSNSYRHDDNIAYHRELATDYAPRVSYHAPSVYREAPPRDMPVEYYPSRRSVETRPDYHRVTTSSRALPDYHPGGLRPEYRSSASMRRYPY
ncbi:unnamed protein product [Cuscuta epithymum]|uniref:DCD domain-containing protein n=2 Tax=Cuscuta epithymum TaxID=186058 RepID=A0AAV0DYU4_9ASTE|nr:unnamed protein product [Cuscuta epithymum]